MLKLFKRKDKLNSNLYDLELKLEAQQKQISELRSLVLELSKQIDTLQIELNYISNEKYKYGKGL